eukprot:TRINITY_DN7752_c0_g1_i1.p1 TRINITY_DN7752_c0_g1~~TRINITY_DN7752_c0_g1_i1.p1  ORF type:complete len:206 (+),score=25.89 TRINITY_DN7752_c0_g1_i1:23-619(+)
MKTNRCTLISTALICGVAVFCGSAGAALLAKNPSAVLSSLCVANPDTCTTDLAHLSRDTRALGVALFSAGLYALLLGAGHVVVVIRDHAALVRVMALLHGLSVLAMVVVFACAARYGSTFIADCDANRTTLYGGTGEEYECGLAQLATVGRLALLGLVVSHSVAAAIGTFQCYRADTKRPPVPEEPGIQMLDPVTGAV